MSKSDIAYLIQKSPKKDEKGVARATETKRQVFVEMDEGTHTEKAANGLLGIGTTCRLKLFAADYNKEDAIEYDGARYVIYDASEYGDYVRLYIRKAKGV